MDVADTQLIDDSLSSPSRSSALGSDDGPFHMPTQLLNTQLLDEFDDRMDKPRHLELDLETQLVDDYDFGDFRKPRRMTVVNHDEASKTQLVRDDEDHSASSSGKYGEVDSALTHLGRAFSRRTPHWLPEFSQNVRSFDPIPGRPSQTISPYGNRYLGETQIISDDENIENHANLIIDHRSFVEARAGAGGYPESLSRDREVPHYLRDFGPNRRDYSGQRMMGSWQEVVGQSDGWESTVRGLRMLDSDASTEDADNHNEKTFNAEVSYPNEAQSSQNVRARVSTHVPLFCGQDLNKSPEPEIMMDDWRDDRVEVAVGGIVENGSNIGILDRVEPPEQEPLQSTSFGNTDNEVLKARTNRAGPSRTAGSIRTACLRASALRASSCSSAGQYSRGTSQGSKSEEVRKVDGDSEIYQNSLTEAGGSMGGNAATTPRRSMEGNGGEGNVLKTSKSGLEEDESDNLNAHKIAVPEVNTCQQTATSSGVDDESCESHEKQLRKGRKLAFGGEENKQESECAGKSEDVQNRSSCERVDRKKSPEVEPLQPSENPSSPDKSSPERRNSFGTGLFSTGSDMSYLNLQSPGEDSQAKALNMVDKLVWLNNTGLPQELQLDEEKGPATGQLNVKSVLQSQLQVAEAKAGMDDPFGVFDWVDSQPDEAAAMFGSGSTKLSASKGTSKSVGAMGNNPQVGLGCKRFFPADTAVARNKRIEKLPEKDKFLKPLPNTSKSKPLGLKSLPMARENKRDKRESLQRRDLTRLVTPENEVDAWHIQPAHDLQESCQDKLGAVSEKGSGDFDRGLKKVEAAVNNYTADNMQSGPTVQAPTQQSSKFTPEHDTKEMLSGAKGLQPIIDSAKGLNRMSKDLRGKDGRNEGGENFRSLNFREGFMQSEPLFPTKSLCEARGSAGAEAMEASVLPFLENISVGGKMDKEVVATDSVDSKFPNPVSRETTNQTSGGRPQRVSTNTNVNAKAKDVDKPGISVILRVDSSDDVPSHQRASDVVKMIEVSPVNSPINEQLSGNSSDVVNVPQDCNFDPPQQNSYGRSQDFEVWSERPGKFEHTHDGSRLHLIVDFNGLRKSESRHESPQPSGNSPLPEKSSCRCAESVLQVKDIQAGPDTQLTGEALELVQSHRTMMSGKGAVRECKNESVAVTSELMVAKTEIASDRRQSSGENLHFTSEKGFISTRRSRSQSRQIVKTLESAGARGGYHNLPSREKGRGRRVTWAGPLEQVPCQGSVLRKGHSLRMHAETLGNDSEDSGGDSCGQDEEPDDTKEAASKVVGPRKRKAGGIGMLGSIDSDLDKIKKKFNMSDAEVARLLGTDEDEATSLKVRSLSLIQPEVEENEVPPPYITRVSKGLRSARPRSEDGLRRLRPVITTDPGKLDGDEVVMYDHANVGLRNTGVTTTLETHPSDNEVAGRRRMRSIADVSSPHLQQTSLGRSPIALGWRRHRGRRVVKSPAESKDDGSDPELTDLPPPIPATPIVIGGFHGKGGLRSARKRKEPEVVPIPSPSEQSMSLSLSSSEEATPKDFKRRKRNETACVLLSHGLSEQTIKQQRKIVAKLGGKLVANASECSHFVADKFVRTGNMLEAMASGRHVVTGEWLETCYEANQFVDEQEFILQDTKKEVEMGFSMLTTLTAARRRPLLEGVRVYVTPGTSPGPDSLARIVNAGGGQIVDEYLGPPPDGEMQSDFCLVISSEEEFEECISLLEQGAKVYTPELLLSGVMSYHLDYANDQLFKNFRRRRSRGTVSTRRTTV